MNGMNCLRDALVRGIRLSMGVKSRWSVLSVKLCIYQHGSQRGSVTESRTGGPQV